MTYNSPFLPEISQTRSGVKFRSDKYVTQSGQPKRGKIWSRRHRTCVLGSEQVCSCGVHFPLGEKHP